VFSVSSAPLGQCFAENKAEIYIDYNERMHGGFRNLKPGPYPIPIFSHIGHPMLSKTHHNYYSTYVPIQVRLCMHNHDSCPCS